MKGYLINSDLSQKSATHVYACALICDESVSSQIESCSEDALKILSIIDSSTPENSIRMLISNTYYAVFIAYLALLFRQEEPEMIKLLNRVLDLVYEGLTDEEVARFMENAPDCRLNVLESLREELKVVDDDKYVKLLSVCNDIIQREIRHENDGIDVLRITHSLWCFSNADVCNLINANIQKIDELFYHGELYPPFFKSHDEFKGVKINHTVTTLVSQIEYVMKEMVKAMDRLSRDGDELPEYERTLISFLVRNRFVGFVPYKIMDRVTDSVV